METIKIKGSLRESLGRRSATLLRREDQVPSELYGKDLNIHFYAHEFEFKPLLFTPNVYIVSLSVDGKTYKCILKDTQFHPLSDKLVHADFLAITDNKPVNIKIPVKLNGSPVGVKEGGKLIVKMRKLNVKGLPKNLPDVLDIDISDLGIGQTVKVEKLSFKNLEILEAKNCVVCSVNITRNALKDQQTSATPATPAK